MVLLFYTTYISVELAHHNIFRAKVGKGGINHSLAIKLPSENEAENIIYCQCCLMLCFA